MFPSMGIPQMGNESSGTEIIIIIIVLVLLCLSCLIGVFFYLQKDDDETLDNCSGHKKHSNCISDSNCLWDRSSMTCSSKETLTDINCVGSWSSCRADCGDKTFTITTPASGRGTVCDHDDGETTQCIPGEGSCPTDYITAAEAAATEAADGVDCVGEWSECGADCNKIFTITTPASGTGTPCVHDNGETNSCSAGEGSCPQPVSQSSDGGSLTNQASSRDRLLGRRSSRSRSRSSPSGRSRSSGRSSGRSRSSGRRRRGRR